MTERVAVYGGSFSPFGNNHLDVVRRAADSGRFDRIIVVPSIAHALKATTFPYEHRVNMATIALEQPGTVVPAVVSMIELHMLREESGPIFTIHLLRRLKAKLSMTVPDPELRFVIGPDIIEELDRWKYVDQIRDEFGFYEVPEDGVHASTVRDMIQSENPEWTRHVAPSVARYIEMHRLYREVQ